MMTMTYVPNEERKKRILYLLKNYPDMEKKRQLLQQQIADFVEIPCDDVIGMLTFARKFSDKVQTGNISNLTQEVALKYREVADKLNAEAVVELLAQFKSLNSEMNILRLCVERLSGNLPRFINDLCFEPMSRNDLCEKYFMTNSTLYRRLNKAVADIDWFLSDQV